ncbi:D-ribitol-5-phosphate cytidylyltransferase-like isoform X2 [Macrobrachium nipponense]|uniref:D-ribitol-5-phosphate cytidylyltransferase-like isoform X2 n=1 Tax=Macrobrachium nipponense TaxID=159736 RepID=UPI0030C7CEC3
MPFANRDRTSFLTSRMEKDTETPKCRVAAVIPAAGCGQRMGNPTPKQYLEVSGRPLILHCLKALTEQPWIERTVVVADDRAKMADILRKEGLSRVTVVTGTGSRHRSIREGVEELSSDPPDVVVVHDGVRPLLPPGILAQVVNAAAQHGAAGAVRPLVSTVIKPDAEGFLQESLVRSQFLNSEMPQAFKYTVLREAYQRCSEHELEHGTECLALALHYCEVKAKLVTGPPQLWKVTDEKDLAVARTLVPRYTRQTLVLCRSLSPTVPYEDGIGLEGEELAKDKDPTKRPTSAVSPECHRGVQMFSTRSESGHSPSEHQRETDLNEGEPSGTATDDQLLPCDQGCHSVYEKIRKSLEDNSHRVFVSNNLKASWPPVCSLIVISNFITVASFKDFARFLFRYLNQRLVTVILVLTLDPALEGLTLSEVSDLQQFLREVSSEISTKVTLLLRKTRNTFSKHQKPQTSHSIEKGTSNESAVELSSFANHYVMKDQILPSGNYVFADDEMTEDSKIRDLIVAILEQTTSCFHGQVLLADED